jgi:hypothetical protein
MRATNRPDVLNARSHHSPPTKKRLPPGEVANERARS